MKQILLYKPIGITPLQLIRQFREVYPDYKNVKLSYAGRLDPMADGLLVILPGDENKKRKLYEDLSKEYECDVLFGAETDTYDILGEVKRGRAREIISSGQILQTYPSFIGKHLQPYPPYSSKPVNGKPLYFWARNNQLRKITIPKKEIEIYNIEYISETKIAGDALGKIIFERINNVTGDFRQNEILMSWKEFFNINSELTFTIFRFRLCCSSGTYIRSFAHNFGRLMHSSAIALSITRTKIGKYNIDKAVRLS